MRRNRLEAAFGFSVGLVVASLLLSGCFLGVGEVSYFANGIKIGEVDQDSAIVWTRLTKVPSLNLEGEKFLEVDKHHVPASDQLPKGSALDDMIGAVPGTAGWVRLVWHPVDGKERVGDWVEVGADTDFTCRFELSDLEASTEYMVRVESRTGGAFSGSFKTAPLAETEAVLKFAVVTCGNFNRKDDPIRGHKSYASMQRMELDFFVHTGDTEYYDKADPFATNLEFARFKLARMHGLPNLVEFHRSVPSYFMKDDHDTLMDDAYPGQVYGELTWEEGKGLFREHFPVLEKNYRTVRWGKDLQIWMVEGRDFRSPNNMPDGPEKTIWGQEQKAWLFDTVAASDATFKILISPTPIVGPDRKKKNDNHSNLGFKHEGDEVRAFIASQENMYVVCGDRHWQYVSVDSEFGVKEFSCGPNSDDHSGGWHVGKLPVHRYLKVQGGYATFSIERIGNKPVLTARHYDVDGNLNNEDVNFAQQ